jgi:hypothetical protein
MAEVPQATKPPQTPSGYPNAGDGEREPHQCFLNQLRNSTDAEFGWNVN